MDIIKNLLKIKSLITILLTVLFIYLAVKGVITGENVMTVFVVIIGFYFGTQTQKKG